jgi:uncharacterized LabA/DUF88 family protein
MESVFLIDGAFFCHKVKQHRGAVRPSDVNEFVKSVRDRFDAGYRLVRTYYYDGPPPDMTVLKPVSREPANFKASEQYSERNRFMRELKRADFVSVREGRVAFRGWVLKDRGARRGDAPLTDDDYKPDFEQKGVDIKIGLDIAWISLGHIAQRIYLVTGDSDFIPAMKFARRSGVQLFLLTLAHGVFDELKNHADVLGEDPIGRFLKLADSGPPAE